MQEGLFMFIDTFQISTASRNTKSTSILYRPLGFVIRKRFASTFIALLVFPPIFMCSAARPRDSPCLGSCGARVSAGSAISMFGHGALYHCSGSTSSSHANPLKDVRCVAVGVQHGTAKTSIAAMRMSSSSGRASVPLRLAWPLS